MNDRLTRSTLAMAAVLLACRLGAQGDPAARFTRALNTDRDVAIAGANPAYNSRPLTVELWAKLNGQRSYNILVANELKSSATHWEMFTLPGSGFLAAYLPGYTPPQLETRLCVTDGKWHYLAMVAETGSVRLYVDGREEATMSVTRPAKLQTVPGPLVFGSLVARELSCDGEIGEARISAVRREIAASPDRLLEADAVTVGLWRFDRTDDAKRFADLSARANHAGCVPAIRTLDRVDLARLSAAESAELAMGGGPPGGRPLAFPPPQVDPAATRAQLAQALEALRLPSLAGAGRTRDAVLADWEELFACLDRELKGTEPLPPGAAEQVFDRQALVYPSDRDPLGVVLRRTEALLGGLQRLKPAANLPQLATDFAALKAAAERIEARDPATRKPYFLAVCALQREIAFANPLLDFERVLFVARGDYLGSRVTGPTTTADVYGQHFATQYYGFNSVPGGGLFVLQDFRTEPKVVNVLANAVVGNGRLKGRKLEPGAFLSPDLSYDGRTILFSYTQNREHKWVWSPETSFHIFRVDVDGSGLTQLTDSQWDDFDACWLPNGRIAFISERRGGYIRCFAVLHVPSHVLHSMNADGSDVRPLSYYETSEWQPSVNHDGMLVYTRWDYTDRENCLGSNFWICFPDGRDPRGPHGNYPYPWHTFEDNRQGDSRLGRPYTEMNIRAIPGSHRYLLTAAPHHGESFGSLAVLDLRPRDDASMSQLRRVTPYAPFPETEIPARSQYPYGTAWPLSEDYYLGNWWENLYLLDRFGNRVLLCENALACGGKTNYDLRLIDPIPVRARPRPPIVPSSTEEGGGSAPATISVLNVYESDQPFPPGTRIRWLRVTQNVLKLNPWIGVPMIGYQNENTPRIPLGIVPVEEDGSAYFEAPVGKELIFQVLDESRMAVQSMRSVAFVHPGEQLTCLGCHDDPQKAPQLSGTPLALRRGPSKLQPEVGPVEPITYYRLVKPVFERSCLPCHQRDGKGPTDMGYEALEPYAFYFAGGMSGTTTKPLHGGARTIPGRFGARNSRLGRALLDEHHRGKVSVEDFRRVVLWLDSNSLRLGAYEDEQKQMRGEVVWPTLDVDPANPQGLATAASSAARSAFARASSR